MTFAMVQLRNFERGNWGNIELFNTFLHHPPVDKLCDEIKGRSVEVLLSFQTSIRALFSGARLAAEGLVAKVDEHDQPLPPTIAQRTNKRDEMYKTIATSDMEFTVVWRI
jgi:hypothetical protein